MDYTEYINDLGVHRQGKAAKFPEEPVEFRIVYINPFQPIYTIENISRFLGCSHMWFMRHKEELQEAGVIRKIKISNHRGKWQFIPYLWMQHEKKKAMEEHEEKYGNQKLYNKSARKIERRVR